MAELKREIVKYVRDKIKKDYKIRDECFICGSKNELELHHLFSIAGLLDKYCRVHKIQKESIDTVQKVEEFRLIFAKYFEKELAHDNLYTLCKKHHSKLHNVYGLKYENIMAEKVRKWLFIQKEKEVC